MKREPPLAFQIKSINNQIKRMFEKSAIVENKANLTGMQYAILGFLTDKRDQDVYQKDIEAEFNIRRSTASAMVSALEKEEYIYRESVPGDGRLKKIVTTNKAQELDAFANKNIEKIQQQITKGISPEELQQFYQTLAKIRQNLKD